MRRLIRRLINILISTVIVVVGFIGLWGFGSWMLLGLIKNNVISNNWTYVLAVIVAVIVGYYAYKAYETLEEDLH